MVVGLKGEFRSRSPSTIWRCEAFGLWTSQIIEDIRMQFLLKTRLDMKYLLVSLISILSLFAESSDRESFCVLEPIGQLYWFEPKVSRWILVY